MTYAVIEDKSGYLNNSFILELACKKLNLTAEAIEAKVGRYVKGKRLGELKGSLHWSKCISGGWKKGLGVIKPNTTYGYYIADYNGNVLFGSDKEEHHLADLSHERWLNNPSAQRQHQEYLADCEAQQQKQIEDKQKLLDKAYSLNDRYGTKFNESVTWDEIYSFLDTLTETTQQVKEVRTMTKAAIWNQLKALGYDSKQLKIDLGITYAQVTKEQLQTVLEATEKHFKTDVSDWRQQATKEMKGEGVKGDLSTDVVEVTVATVKENEVNSSETPVNYIVTLADYPQYELATKVEQAENDEDCHWLKLVDIQNCFSEAGNYHYSQMQLTPKLHLFSLMTEFVYLANCLSYFISLLIDVDEELNSIAADVFDSWFNICYLLTGSYIKQPLPSCKDYSQMLSIWHQERYKSA